MYTSVNCTMYKKCSLFIVEIPLVKHFVNAFSTTCIMTITVALCYVYHCTIDIGCDLLDCWTDLGRELVPLGGVDQSPLVHAGVQVLLRTVKGDEGLVGTKFTCRAKVGQLEHITARTRGTLNHLV